MQAERHRCLFWRRRDEDDTDADDATDWAEDEEGTAATSPRGPLSSRDGASTALQVTLVDPVHAHGMASLQ